MTAQQILDSEEGLALLAQVRTLGTTLRTALRALGYETIMGDAPITPIFMRDTEKTATLVEYLFAQNILVTGL